MIEFGWLAGHAGSARVDGDEEEDDIDDLENELNFDGSRKQDMHGAGLAVDAMLHGHTGYGLASKFGFAQLPLLNNGQMVLLLLYSLPS